MPKIRFFLNSGQRLIVNCQLYCARQGFATRRQKAVGRGRCKPSCGPFCFLSRKFIPGKVYDRVLRKYGMQSVNGKKLRNFRLKLRNFRLKLRNFGPKLRNYGPKLRNYRVKLRNYGVKLRNFAP